MKHRYTNNPVDDLWINLNHMPFNSRLKDNATVLILHNLQICIELSDQPGEHDACTIVEVAPVICLNDVIDNIKESYQNISPDYILALEAAKPSSVLWRTLRCELPADMILQKLIQPFWQKKYK
jgi:hypothetical protein